MFISSNFNVLLKRKFSFIPGYLNQCITVFFGNFFKVNKMSKINPSFHFLFNSLYKSGFNIAYTDHWVVLNNFSESSFRICILYAEL